jgi:hypothetical protein
MMGEWWDLVRLYGFLKARTTSWAAIVGQLDFPDYNFIPSMKVLGRT